MKYFKINVIIIPLIFILSCGDNPDAKIIVDEYLFEQLIDSLDNKHELKSKEILIGRYESNEVIEFIKQDLENEFGRDSVDPGSLVKELIPTLGDSINFNSHTDFKDYNIIWGVQVENPLATFTQKINVFFICQKRFIHLIKKQVVFMFQLVR